MPVSEHVQFCRCRRLPEVELVSVAYRERSFPDHHHAEFVIGAITAGTEILTVDRHTYRAGHGNVLHANATCDGETLHYEVLYIPGSVLERHLAMPLTRGWIVGTSPNRYARRHARLG